MKIQKLFAPFAAAGMACVFAAPVRVAAASPAPARYEGAASSEILPLHRTEIEVEREVLTLRADSAPVGGYETNTPSEEGAAYTAEYTLYNPTDTDETVRLALPLGFLPEYVAPPAEGEQGDVAKCELLLNGEPVKYALRYRCDPYRRDLAAYSLSAEELLAPPPAFFAADLPVREYRFTASLPEKRDRDEIYLLRAELEYNPVRTRFVSEDMRTHGAENGVVAVTFWMRGEGTPETFSLTAFGEEARIRRCEVVANYGYSELPEPLAGAEAGFETGETISFSEYAKGLFALQNDMSGEDAFLCAAQLLDSATNGDDAMGWISVPDAHAFFRWLDYEITVPAGGRATHRVTAPLYPTLSNRYLFYLHDFSAARQWARYGDLKIAVVSDGASQLDSSRYRFESAREGFVHEQSSLPMSNLEFTLSGIEMSSCIPGSFEGGLSELDVAFIILGVLAAGAAAWVTAVLVRRAKRKARSKSETADRK